MQTGQLKIFFDGGCRPNPGQVETAVVVRGVAYIRHDCGFGSSNDAEWLALIHAAEVALSLGARNVIMLGDSALVVGQANRTAKCRNASFKSYLQHFEALAKNFDHITVRHVARTQNLAGIALARAHH